MLDLQTIGIGIDTQGLEKGTRALGDTEKAAHKAADGADKVTDRFGVTSKATNMLATAAAALGSVWAAFKVYDLIKDAALLAARYETMGVVMRIAGNNAGYTMSQMMAMSQQLQKSGISMLESRNALTQLATANIDLANASKLARAAQDVAVVGNINSSEALARMIHGIKSGEVEILRTMGLNVNFEASYKSMANQLGITTEALSTEQKALARTNAALQEASRYNGIYEESMDTAGKAMGSLTRYWEDFMVKAGDAFLPALATAVFTLTDALKLMNAEMDKAGNGAIASVGSALNGILKIALETVAVLGANVAFTIRMIIGEVATLATQAVAIGHLDFKGASAIGKDWVAESNAARAGLDAFEKRILGVGQTTKAVSKMSEAERIAAGQASKEAAANATKQSEQGKALLDFTKSYGTEAQKADLATKEWKNRLGSLFTPEMEAKLRKSMSKGKGGESAINDALSEQIQVYKNADKAILDSRADFNTQMGFQTKLGLKTSLEAISEGLDNEFQVWMGRSALLHQELELTKQKKNSQKEQEVIVGKLADLERDYTQAQLKGAGETAVILKQRTTAYEEAEAAAKNYLDTLNRQYARDIEGMGQGGKARSRNAGLAQIEDRYGQQLLQLESDKRQGAFKDDPQRYEEEVSRIKRFQAAALDSYRRYYGSLTEVEGSWRLGAAEGMQNYLDTSSNVFSQMESLTSKAFSGMEDALVNFVKTGKLDFRSLAESIITDLIRIQIKAAAVNMLGGSSGGGGSGWLGALFSAGVGYFTGGGGMDMGGINANSGEYMGSLEFDGGGYTGDGPRSGGIDGKGGFRATLHPQETVIDHTKPGGGVGLGSGKAPISVVVYVDAKGTKSESDDQSARAAGDKFGSAVRNILVEEQMPGGLLS